MRWGGDLNTMAATEMQPMLDELLHEIDRPVLVDVTRLEYISSSGLRHFMAIRKKAAANGQHVTIQGMSKNLRSIFHMTGFDAQFDIL